MKKYFTIWSIIWLPYCCLGQQYWERTYPPFGGDSERPTCAAQGRNGDLWLVTRSSSSSNNSWSETLIRIDSFGRLMQSFPLERDSVTTYSEESQMLWLSDGSLLLVGLASEKNLDKGSLRKIRPDGTQVWVAQHALGNLNFEVFDRAVELADGRILAFGRQTDANVHSGPALVYFDSTGNMLDVKPVRRAPDTTFNEYFSSVVFTPDGNSLSMFILQPNTLNSQILLVFADTTGNALSTDTIDAYSGRLAVAADGSYVTISHKYTSGTQAATAGLDKYDILGQHLWSKTWELPQPTTDFNQIIPNSDTGFSMLLGSYESPVATPVPRWQRYFARFSDDGELQHFSRLYWSGLFQPSILIPSSDGGVSGVGGYTQYEYPYVLNRTFCFHLDSLGYTLPNRLEGRIALDQNHSCTVEEDEKGLEGFMVRLNRPGEEPLYARSDWEGNFEMEVDMGPYTLEVFGPGAQWKACSANWPISFAARYDTLTIAIPVQAVAEHPVIETEAVLSSLKRCASNTVEILYRNRSALASDSVWLWVALDPAMTFLSADFTPPSILGDTLLFHLPELQANEARRFKIKFQLECGASVSGQTHGVTAWAETPALTPAWDGADLRVKTECLQDSTVRIEISNSGTGGAPQPLPYQVIHNDAIWLSSVLPVAPGAQASSNFPADGGYWYVSIRQPDGHPWLRYTAVGLEGCGGDASPGGLLQWSAQDDAPFAARENWPEGQTAAANAIVAAPAGLGADHAISAADDIEYTIFFRNQTELVSKYPFIRDTLSPWLDISTLRVTASTLPCQLTFEPNNIVRFNFSGELIQPEFLNPKASGGYVRFRIKPFADAPAGTVIRTSSVFWPNLYKPLYPVSDQTFHRIGVSIPVSVSNLEGKGSGLETTPNPATTFAQIRLTGGAQRQNRLFVRNATGQTVFQTTFSGDQYRLQRAANWPDGVYFLGIQTDTGAYPVSKLLFVSH